MQSPLILNLGQFVLSTKHRHITSESRSTPLHSLPLSLSLSVSLFLFLCLCLQTTLSGKRQLQYYEDTQGGLNKAVNEEQCESCRQQFLQLQPSLHTPGGHLDCNLISQNHRAKPFLNFSPTGTRTDQYLFSKLLNFGVLFYATIIKQVTLQD